MPLPTVLAIQHVEGTEPPQFIVRRASDHKTAPAVVVAPPNNVRIEGRPNDNLTNQLRWYLEQFLDYPFSPDVEYADRVQAALRRWGRETFEALFGSGRNRDFYHDAKRNGLSLLTLQIVSDSPHILGWPWEVLEDAETSRLAHQCNIERRTSKQGDPDALGELPKDRVNVLLIIARPLIGDVKYRSISRYLVEFAARHPFPIAVDLLRPPTFDHLREHLQKHPKHYHMLHFDGHGSYRNDAPIPNGGHTLLKSTEGRLLFETADGGKHPVDAESLSELLREHAVPAVVLNACQSAMIDDCAADPFASVAASLLKGGTRTVVAMAYALYVSGAQQFLPAFYQRLFESGSLPAAVRAGRQQMRAQQNRVCVRGTFPLEDWLVPVVYQQDPLDFSFVTSGTTTASKPMTKRLPVEAEEDPSRDPYRFVGRDGALLALERSLQRPPAGILISGLGGIGKTTLVRGFLRWLNQTGGLLVGAYWFDFRNLRSAEYLFNRLGEMLTGQPEFAAQPVEQKIATLVPICRERPHRIVWDNFESARGVAGTSVTGNLPAAELSWLRDFLTQLRGGATKILITSRSSEDWLGPTNLGQPVSLGGLDGEECWSFANEVLVDHALKQDPDRPNPQIKKLLDLLKGHPLAMRVILPKLANLSADQLIAALKNNLIHELESTPDENAASLAAMLSFATASFPSDWQRILVGLGLHEEYVDAEVFARMAEHHPDPPLPTTIDLCLSALRNCGLVRGLSEFIFEVHPLLASYLRTVHARLEPPIQEVWTRAFVNVMGLLADHYSPLPLHEQRSVFQIHEVNFHNAREAANRLGLNDTYAALTQVLAVYSQNTRNFPTAAKLFGELQSHFAKSRDEPGAASTYHQLGIVAQERRDFTAAEQWYRKSLTIKEKLGNEPGAAITYHQLGIVAQERRDFTAAEQWYRKSLTIKEKLGNEPGAASTYHQLGRVAEERRDFTAAEQWYRKSLTINEKLGNEPGAAITYHQLGIVAQERRDFTAAEQWYRKSLTIKEKLGNEPGAASTYHQLGIVAQERRDFTAAEQWYRKSLTINEKLGNEPGAAITYHQLGIVAQERRDFTAAEQWYRKSLTIEEKLGNEPGAASTYHQLGRVAQERRDFTAAEQWYRKSLTIKEKLGNEPGAASTYHQLGRVAEERRDFVVAWQRYLRAFSTFASHKDIHSGAIVAHSLARSFRNASSDLRAQMRTQAQTAGLSESLLQTIEKAALESPSENSP